MNGSATSPELDRLIQLLARLPGLGPYRRSRIVIEIDRHRPL